MPKKYEEKILVEFERGGVCMIVFKSDKPITQEQIVEYLINERLYDEDEGDSYIFLTDEDIDTVDLDKESE